MRQQAAAGLYRLRFAKTKREVTEQQAAQLKAMLNPQIKAVGVFVNAEIDKILRLAESRTIDIIQLHGDEDAAYCERLRLQTELPIIKAVRVKDAGSFDNLQAYPCDYLLFDTYTKGQYGGTGKRFDLALVADEKSRSRILSQAVLRQRMLQMY